MISWPEIAIGELESVNQLTAAAHDTQLSSTIICRFIFPTPAASARAHESMQPSQHSMGAPSRQARQHAELCNDDRSLVQDILGDAGAVECGQHDLQARARNCT